MEKYRGERAWNIWDLVGEIDIHEGEIKNKAGEGSRN